MLIAELALVLHYPYLLPLVSPLLSVSSDRWDLRYSHLAAAPAKLWSFCRGMEPWLSLRDVGACCKWRLAVLWADLGGMCVTSVLLSGASDPRARRVLRSIW